MTCENYDEDNEVCNYFASLRGTGEDPPTGMNPDDGSCRALHDQDDNWFMVEREDCDMFDLE